MKILILTGVALIFLAHNCIAQDTDSNSRNDIQFGLKTGINYSNVYDEQGDEFKVDPKFGFVAGGFVAIPIGKFLGFQPELLFSQKGFKATGSLLGSNYDLTRTTNFIDVPLLLSVKLNRFLTLLAGPQYSYLLKQKDVFSNNILSLGQEQEFKNDNIRKNILCFTGGIDVNVNPLVVGARTGWDIQKNNGDGTSATPRYKNAWLQFTLGYKL